MAQSHDKMLHRLQKESFDYFAREYNPSNGLVRDKTEGLSPSSIAVTGFSLAACIVAVERGFISRSEALRRILTAVRFFAGSSHEAETDATGQRGFYYHFLDMKSGRRAWACELSTMDTGFLILGMLVAAEYFSGANARERELRERVEELYHRVEWNWACNRAQTLSHGYSPEKGFLKYRWRGYNEGLPLYLLALGSAAHPLSGENYRAWTRTYQWRCVYGYEYLYAGPLFIHQFMHAWIDFRGLQDDFMREKSMDYFENSRRATYVQREYCRRNSRNFECRSELSWGITACDGPGPCVRQIERRKMRFFGYHARGVPFGPDDGTVSAGAAVASLPFAPEIVLPTIEYFLKTEVGRHDPCGFAASFNPMFGDSTSQGFWRSKHHYGLNHGPLILMIENFRSGLIWRLMRNCQPIIRGLQRAGFSGAWLPVQSEGSGQRR
jgi:hypothetical protein